MNYCQFRNEFIKRMANAGGGYNPNTVLLAQLNGDISDLSQNHYTPTITGSPTFVPGYFSGTLACKISNNNVFGFYGLASNLNGDFTLDFFQFSSLPRDITLGRYAIVTSRNSAYGGLGILSNTSATANGLSSTIHISYNYDTWYHIALTRQNGITRIFTNGVLAGQLSTNYEAGVNTRVSSVLEYVDQRYMTVSNMRLSNVALHNESGGVYTFPVPTELYTN